MRFLLVYLGVLICLFAVVVLLLGCVLCFNCWEGAIMVIWFWFADFGVVLILMLLLCVVLVELLDFILFLRFVGI